MGAGRTDPVIGSDKVDNVSSDATAAMANEKSMDNALLSMQSNDPPLNRLIVLSIPGLSFQEINTESLAKLPHVRFLAENGMLTAVNLRTPTRGLDDVYLSIGAGGPATARTDDIAVMAGERIGGITGSELFARYQRRLPPSGATVLLPEIAELMQANDITSHLTHSTRVGRLGEALLRGNVSRYVFGNADTGFLPGPASKAGISGTGVGTLEEPEAGSEGIVPQTQTGGLPPGERVLRRYAPLMLTDAAGSAGSGDISEVTLVPDASRPFGVRTNYERLLQQIRTAARPSFILVELGDFYRLYRERNAYSEGAFAESKEEALQDIDVFVGDILAELGNDSGLWLFSPWINADASKQQQRLAPALFYTGSTTPGVFYSDTTRRDGIATYADLAPTMLSQLHLPVPEGMTGIPLQRAVSSKAYTGSAVDVPGEAMSSLERELKRIQSVYQLRPQVLYPYVSYEIVILLYCLLLLVAKISPKGPLLKTALYTLLTAPPVMLLLGWLVDLGKARTVALFLLLTVGAALLLRRLPLLQALIAASFGTVLLLLADGITGAQAMKHSLLGYDAMVGARYYGIGNEFMGILIGAVVLGTSGLVQQLQSSKPRQIHRGRVSQLQVRRVMPWIVIIYLAIFLYLALPMLGTNAGGAVTSMVAFGISWMLLKPAGPLSRMNGWKVLAVAIGLTAAAFALLWLVNGLLLLTNNRESHIGRAIHTLTSGNVDVIRAMIVRKLLMNWHLVIASVWSKVLICSMVIITALLLRPQGVFRRWKESTPSLMHGFTANMAGALVAFLVNDSGIVAAATMIGYVVVPMLLLKLQESSASHSP